MNNDKQTISASLHTNITMQYNKLGNTDLYVSPVAFGVLTVGKGQQNLSIEEGSEVIKYAISKGINFFDTAQDYKTYPYLKQALKDIDMTLPANQRPIISTKCVKKSYSEMEDAIKEALREMNLKTIDIFLLHEIRQDPDWHQRAGAWQCLKDYKAKGIINSIGISTHHIDVVQRAASIPQCDVVFPLINYASLGIRKGAGMGDAKEMALAIDKCHRAGKGIYLMKAFGGGLLTGTYLKALDYVFGLKGVDSVMVGMAKNSEVDNLVDYINGKLPNDFQPDVQHKTIRIFEDDCIGCGACVKRCPNKALSLKENGRAQIDSDVCITCSYCAPVCPVRAIIMW